MARKKDIHVVPRPDGWGGITEGSKRAAFVVPTKKAAMEKARDIARARGCERVEHNSKGRIVGSDSYGNDPCPPKDKEH